MLSGPTTPRHGHGMAHEGSAQGRTRQGVAALGRTGTAKVGRKRPRAEEDRLLAVRARRLRDVPCASACVRACRTLLCPVAVRCIRLRILQHGITDGAGSPTARCALRACVRAWLHARTQACRFARACASVCVSANVCLCARACARHAHGTSGPLPRSLHCHARYAPHVPRCAPA
jgi:hypothetical protein